MHTVISAFQDKGQAERSVDRLVELGIRRGDVHIEHRGASRDSALANFGAFFVSLLGQDAPGGRHADHYARAVEHGRYVVVADAMDEVQAQRASEILGEMGGEGSDTVHRPLLRPLRDIVAVREVLADQATQAPRERSRTQQLEAEQRERAFAFGGAKGEVGGKDKPRR